MPSLSQALMIAQLYCADHQHGAIYDEQFKNCPEILQTLNERRLKELYEGEKADDKRDRDVLNKLKETK